ncbi:MAG: hypothetical protein P0S94_02820, partial [Simkaniaceae bacterium]|nr:hypothetical protein [Simkaniaceae bacterium]
MQALKKLMLSLLILVTPALFTYPEISTPPMTAPLNYNELTYHNIVQLIDSIESGKIDPRQVDIEKVNAFVASLAKQGLQDDENIDDDIDTLLNGAETSIECCFATGYEQNCLTIPGVYTHTTKGQLLYSKNCFSKAWKQTKKFVKKHKKAVIIGAVVVVIVTIAIATSSSPNDMSSLTSSDIKPKVDEHAQKIKETIAGLPEKNHYLTIEERAKIIGSLYAHEMYMHDPTLSLSRDAIDQNFATNYAPLYENQHRPVEALYHNILGEHSLANHHLKQAVTDFNNALAIDPTMTDPYLNRGVANFGLGQYKESLQDFDAYTAQQTDPPTTEIFTKAFLKGARQGAAESGKGFFLFVYDIAAHPIQTTKQVYDAFATLSQLAVTNEWGEIGKTLSPEIHTLISQWDILTEQEKGHLAGKAFGSIGIDIALPGATVKAASKCAKGARILNKGRRNLIAAERTLLLESTSALKTPTKVKSFVNSTSKTLALADDLGLNGHQIGKLKSAGKLEKITKLEKEISSWLGKESKCIYNKAGDPVFLSKDGLRKVRFDFKRPNPHQSPHMHLERLEKGHWKEIKRVY